MSQDAISEWINYWREESKWESPPYFTCEDRSVLDNSKIGVETFTCFEEFSKSEALFSEQPSIHGGLLPGPYMGDLRNAKVVICLLNPGFRRASDLPSGTGIPATGSPSCTKH